MEQIKQKLTEYLSLAKKLQDFLSVAPKEKLRIRKKGTNYQYYVEKNKKRVYIPKKNIEIAKKIAQRDYYQKLMPILQKNTKIMNYFICNFNPCNLEECYLELSDARKELVNPIFIDNDIFALQWQSKKYERKKDSPDGYFLTLKNEPVRSKSEIIIANLLNSKKIPYHYEYPVHLHNGMTIYPDFFCLNKRTRQEFYWEHFGRMDDSEYTITMTKKISDYSKNGIILGKNLLITLETVMFPLETRTVENLIESFLI